MASLSQPHGDQSAEDTPFAFGYMMMPTDAGMGDQAAQEREFQNEINSLNNLFAADPYAGMDTLNPFANPPSQLPTNHEFTFSPPVVHGVDAVYFNQPQHMSSMSAPYMGMHNPAFEFIGFDPANPYTPTEGVTNSFADLNMAANALAGTAPPGSGILQSLETGMDANTPTSSHSTLQSPNQNSNYDGASPKHVEPTAENFFLPYPEPNRRIQKPPQATSQLLRFPHFGSDPAFSERFTRPTESPTFADVSDRLERKTRFALRPSHSEDNTPASSPHPRRPSVLQSGDRGESADSDQSANNDAGANSKRRRIGSSSQDASTSDDERPSDSQSRNAHNSSSPPRNRRKSSSGNASAAARRNLTEEQRRQNHNKSEQRRRTVITDDLTLVRHLVPALTNTTASKAIAIRETYQFLYELVESNKELEQSLGPEIARAGPYPSAEFSRPTPQPPPGGL